MSRRVEDILTSLPARGPRGTVTANGVTADCGAWHLDADVKRGMGVIVAARVWASIDTPPGYGFSAVTNTSATVAFVLTSYQGHAFRGSGVIDGTVSFMERGLTLAVNELEVHEPTSTERA